MRVSVLALVVSVSTLATVPVYAATLSGSGSGFTGSATITTQANNDGSGSSTITGISGTGFDGLIVAGGFFSPSTGQQNDNLLYPSTPAGYVDDNGFAFNYEMGPDTFQVDIFSDTMGNYYADFIDEDNYENLVDVTLTLSNYTPNSLGLFRSMSVTQNQSYSITFAPQAVGVTPEPSSLALLGTGLVGTVGVLRRRFRQN